MGRRSKNETLSCEREEKMKNFLFNLAFVVSVIFLIGVFLNLENELGSKPTIETQHVQHEEDDSEHFEFDDTYVPTIMPFGIL